MYPYLPITEKDRKEMLKEIGVSSIDELFSDIPEKFRLSKLLDIPRAKSELDVRRDFESAAARNSSLYGKVSFLGAGAYRHYIPSVVNHMVSRSEFYTAYTPYQPEISQGTLVSIFEFQTHVANIFGMDVANASMYDGASATAEAALLALRMNRGRGRIALSRMLHPEYRETVETYLHGQGYEIVEIPALEGKVDIEALKDILTEDTVGVVIQSPNFLGMVEDIPLISDIVHKVKNASLIVAVSEPMAYGILEAPGNLGADIVAAELQSFGLPLNYGGPYVGVIAAKEKYLRKMPGRLVGMTEDVDGNRGFVLTLQAREQHIKRAKATSNICSNEGLCALTVSVYLSLVGKEGLRAISYQNFAKTQYFISALRNNSIEVMSNKVFNEFAFKPNIPVEELNVRLKAKGIVGGLNLGRFYPEYEEYMLVAVTELIRKEDIDSFLSVMEGV